MRRIGRLVAMVRLRVLTTNDWPLWRDARLAALGVCELRSVWVGPEARGRGVADQLIGAVETWARRSGTTALKLAVIPGNHPAVAVYARNGFVLTVERGDLLSDGVTREQVMAKTLR